MPRSARVLVDEGYYHVFTRGIDKRILFPAASDYQYFLETVDYYQNKFELKILHYALMPNHFHLLLQTVLSKELPEFMKRILQVYACYYRRRYNSTGFVFQNRYKSKLIHHAKYLLDCGRYIERNPLRAGLVDDLADWRWSSYQYYGLKKADPLVRLFDPLYEGISTDTGKREELYRELLRQERPYDDVIDKEFQIE